MKLHDYGLPQGQVPVLRVPATPAHTTTGGDIFGGWIMSQVDIAGSIPAVLRAKGRVVTAAVNSMTFLTPVFVGDILSLYASIAKVGRTSVTVGVEVFAQRNPTAPECVKVTQASLTYVAVNEQGRPRDLPEND
jgi:acyl-CoA thioesterase YciA